MRTVFARLTRADLSATPARRDLPPDFRETSQSFDEMYDRTTLWYDAIWTGRRVALVCPLLLNLEPLLTGGQVRLDGRAARPLRVEHRMSHSVVWFRAPTRPATVSAEIDGQRLETAVSDRSDAALFAGLNTVVLLQKNNDPAWIRDFLIYHRVRHGLQAALVFDNGSDRTTPDDLAEICAEAGLEAAAILSVPYRFGPVAQRASGSLNWAGLSLQYALLNIARLRFLTRARAVLQCDIDELVHCRSGRSVFDLARRHPLGLVRFGLSWRYPQPVDGGPQRHRDHIWRRTVPDLCPPKYCINPRGLMGWASWGVHDLAFRGARHLPLSRDAEAWHCRQITTGWKASRSSYVPPDDLIRDPAFADAMAAVDFEARTPGAVPDLLRDDRDA